MQKFNMGNLAQWKEAKHGEGYVFDLPVSGFRAVQFEVMADGPTTIKALVGDSAYTIARGEGMMEVRFTTDMEAAIAFFPDDKSFDVHFKTHVDTQLLAVDEETFTTVQPLEPPLPPEMQRVVDAMRWNEFQRRKALEEERELIEQEREALKAEREKSAAPPPNLEERMQQAAVGGAAGSAPAAKAEQPVQQAAAGGTNGASSND